MSHFRPSTLRSIFCGALTTAWMSVALLVGPAQASQRSCNPPKYPGNGYFTSLKVSRTSCATGRRVALAWYHCRTKHGPAGRCHTQVLGFTCHEKRVSIATQFDARVTCDKGRATVVHTYQQNT
jgi:hypothetical protein